jgi:O-antigen ligase
MTVDGQSVYDMTVTSAKQRPIAQRVGPVVQFSVLVLFGSSATVILSAVAGTPNTISVLVVLLVLLLLGMAFHRVLGKIAGALRCMKWWQILWLLVFISGLVFRDRDLHAIETDVVDGWAIFRIALVCVTAVVLLARLSLRQTPWLQQMCSGLTAALGVYCLVCLASCLWSVYPLWTVYKSLEFLVDVATLAAIIATAASVRTYKVLFDWTWTLQGLLLASVWLGLLLWRQEALVPSEGVWGVMLTGVVPDVNSNSVGELGAVIGVIAFCRLLVSSGTTAARACYAFLLAIGIVTMCLAQGRSAIVGFILGTILALLFSGRVAVGFSLASASAVLLSFESIRSAFSGFMRRGEAEDALYRLSDRMDWWSSAWSRIMQHPWAGYGAFAGARFLVMAENKIDAGIHSDWVEILVGTGLLGFVIAVLAVLATWWQLVKCARDSFLTPLERQLAIEAIAVLGVESVRSIFTTDLFWHPPIIFFACVGYAEFLRLRRKQKHTLIAPSPARAPAPAY